MKKNSLKLEKDANDESIYYVTFDYISTANFNIRIFFNGCENNTTNKNFEEEDAKNNYNNNEDNAAKRINRQMDLLKDELIIQEEANDKKENENYLNSNLSKSNFKK